MTAAPTAAPSETLLELIGVRKSYRFGETEVRALDGVDLAIRRGTFTGIVGRSGSGKSTLLNVLGGLDRPSEGTVLVEGRPLKGRGSDELAEYRRATVGFIFQSFNLIAHLTALENVALPLRLAGKLGYFERRKKAEELLDRVGLGKRLEHRPSELSGGERQRVAIARALANDPGMLLADEPTGNLDSRTADEIMAMLRGLHADGRTVVLVTHDMRQAEQYCERLLVLQDGRVKEERDLRNGGPAKGGGAAAESEEQPPEVAVKVATNRCPYCHDDVEVAAPDWVACRACQARHHQACWNESGACGACGEARYVSDGPSSSQGESEASA